VDAVSQYSFSITQYNTFMKYLTSIWTTILLGITLCVIRIADPQILEQFRLSIFDQYIQSIPVEKSNDIVLINIGESSLEKYGQYPWPRQNYAQMISDLRNANAGYDWIYYYVSRSR